MDSSLQNTADLTTGNLEQQNQMLFRSGSTTSANMHGKSAGGGGAFVPPERNTTHGIDHGVRDTTPVKMRSDPQFVPRSPTRVILYQVPAGVARFLDIFRFEVPEDIRDFLAESSGKYANVPNVSPR